MTTSLLVSTMISNKELTEKFMQRVGYRPNFDKPTTFNEKIGYRKLYQHAEEHVWMSNKILSKTMAQKNCPEIKVHQVLWSGHEENMIVLKAPCIVKTAAGSGQNIVVVDPVHYASRMEIIGKLKKYKKKQYGYDKGEWAYSEVPWTVFTEEYEERKFHDIKFFVFHGKVQVVNVMTYAEGHRITNFSYFRPDGTFIDVKNGKEPVTVREVPLSAEALAKGVRLAEQCSGGCDFVRVDLYYIEKGKEWFFGEYTLYPTSGMSKFIPEEFDRELGAYWRLP